MKNRTQTKLSTVNCQLSTVNQGGSALIVTLLIITILISLTVEFVYEVYIGTTALSNWSNAQKASLIAKSGQTLSSHYLGEFGKFSYTSQREIYIPVVMDFGADTILTINIEDENSKFNINSIIYPNGLTNEEALSSLKKLLEYLNIDPSYALAIADWIDPDHEPRLRDSEYRAKNVYLWSVDELKLISELDEKIFNTITPFITVYGNGSNEININTAKLSVILSLHNGITETLAKRIIDYRESRPFENRAHLQRVSGMGAIGQQILGRINVKSSHFRVITKATVSDITRIIESVMDTSKKVQHWREG